MEEIISCRREDREEMFLNLKTEHQDNEYMDEEIGRCSILNLRSLPYIGVYGESYRFLSIISASKYVNIKDIEQLFINIPKKAQSAIKDLMKNQSFEINKIEYLSVRYSSSEYKYDFLDNGNVWTRFNIAFHPYLMKNMKEYSHEEKKYIMASIYTEDDLAFGIKESDFDKIMINSTNLYLAENWIEVYVHRSNENDPKNYCVSPNNASFMIDMSNPVISFFSVAIDILENQHKINILVTHHLISDNHDCESCQNPLHSLCDQYSPVNFHQLFYQREDLMMYIRDSENFNPMVNQIQCYIRGKFNFYSMIMIERRINTFDEILYFIKMFIWDSFVSCKQRFFTNADSIEDLISKYETFLKKK